MVAVGCVRTAAAVSVVVVVLTALHIAYCCTAMGAFTQRRDSEYEGEDSNLNVTWISSPFSWLFYVTMIAAFRWALYYFVPASVCSWEMGWTVTHVVHGVVRSVTCGCG